jgi:amino acid efflux transporter
MKTRGLEKQKIRLPQITALYIGTVLGSGILLIPGLAADISGPASLLAWGIMSLLVIPMALTMGLLSASYPDAGGVSYFVSKAFNPRAGSLVGWFFLMSVATGAPVITLTGAGYLCAALGWGESARIILAGIMLLAGITINYSGIKITGSLQLIVVLAIIGIFAVTLAGSIWKISPANYEPFMPRGWMSVGQSIVIIFWCFLGWEAISNMSAEFENPKKNAVKGTMIAAVIISAIYLLTAYVVVGTKSYGNGMSDASLIYIIEGSYGQNGALIAGCSAFFICLAPIIAYVGAASRLAYSLSVNGYAPKELSTMSKHRTPTGGLLFLAACFIVILAAFSAMTISISTLIELPNTTFILTYICGCAAGIRLLKGDRFGVAVSAVSLVLTGTMFFFVDWKTVFYYPLGIFLIWLYFDWKKGMNEQRS